MNTKAYFGVRSFGRLPRHPLTSRRQVLVCLTRTFLHECIKARARITHGGHGIHYSAAGQPTGCNSLERNGESKVGAVRLFR